MTAEYVNAKDIVKLEQSLIEAHYLGLSLRRFGRREDFRYGAVTAFVGDMLIGWARFIGARQHAGEPLFEREAPSAEAGANDRRRNARRQPES